MRILGIDPGLVGGMACIEFTNHHYRLLDATDIPISGDEARRRVHVVLVKNLLHKWKPEKAFIERAGLFPGQNVAAGGLYMRACGMLEATVVLEGIPLWIIEAGSWKKRWRLPGVTAAGSASASKEAARQKAIEIWGGHPALARKADHGRAEASLIALYGAETHAAVEAQQPTEEQLSLLAR